MKGEMERGQRGTRTVLHIVLCLRSLISMTKKAQSIMLRIAPIHTAPPHRPRSPPNPYYPQLDVHSTCPTSLKRPESHSTAISALSTKLRTGPVDGWCDRVRSPTRSHPDPNGQYSEIDSITPLHWCTGVTAPKLRFSDGGSLPHSTRNKVVTAAIIDSE